MPDEFGPWIQVWKEPRWWLWPWCAYIESLGFLETAWTREGAIKKARKAYAKWLEPQPPAPPRERVPLVP